MKNIDNPDEDDEASIKALRRRMRASYDRQRWSLRLSWGLVAGLLVILARWL